VPVVLGTDNVQDAFCPMGSYDPLDALALLSFSGQLSAVFDQASRMICDATQLGIHQLDPTFKTPLSLVGQPAHFVIFKQTNPYTWPLQSAQRSIIRNGTLCLSSID
jgi:cytosine deaminase